MGQLLCNTLYILSPLSCILLGSKVLIDISKMKKYRAVCRLESGWGEGAGWNKDTSTSPYISVPLSTIFRMD